MNKNIKNQENNGTSVKRGPSKDQALPKVSRARDNQSGNSEEEIYRSPQDGRVLLSSDYDDDDDASERFGEGWQGE